MWNYKIIQKLMKQEFVQDYQYLKFQRKCLDHKIIHNIQEFHLNQKKILDPNLYFIQKINKQIQLLINLNFGMNLFVPQKKTK